MNAFISLGLPIVGTFALCLGCSAAAAANLSIPHPDDSSKHVEYFIKKPTGKGPWPTIVLLHGHQDGDRPGGKDFVDWGVMKRLAERGYLAVAVSQPGYGNSDGPADFCGPFTQHAVAAVIAKVREERLALSDNLLLFGISRGALTAGLVAADDPSVSGLVLISGVYDLPQYVAESQTHPDRAVILSSIVAETGGGSDDALKARSIRHVAIGIHASTLILHGAKDTRTSAEQAQRLAEELSQRGVAAKAIVYPDHGHRIPVEVRNRDIDPFIDRVLQGKR